MASLYDHPRYYDLAFSFRDVAGEVSVMEEAIRRCSTIPARRVLEIACGHGPHAGEWMARGYDYLGLDLSDTMMAYGMERHRGTERAPTFLKADMRDFELDEPVDFVYVLLGSLYVTTTPDLFAHFDAVARALKPGGLYFMDWVIDFDPHVDLCDTWHVDEDGVYMRVSYVTSCVNRIEQTYRERVVMEVEQSGTSTTIEGEAVKRAIFPQEFLAMIAARPDFEFVGWWNEWDLSDPLDGTESTNRPVIVVRRTA
ncbi:MAG: class I SAM-dependent methyltransferase [bacterium]|nr:class I SAM-dependent methyltransferase [bacterium]